MIIKIFSLMAEDKSLVVLAAEMELSTQEAARFLNFSRSFVIKLLEEGKIPSRKVGKKRRVLLADVLCYKRQFERGRMRD
jgi:excisionase family DNA binding protein